MVLGIRSCKGHREYQGLGDVSLSSGTSSPGETGWQPTRRCGQGTELRTRTCQTGVQIRLQREGEARLLLPFLPLGIQQIWGGRSHRPCGPVGCQKQINQSQTHQNAVVQAEKETLLGSCDLVWSSEHQEEQLEGLEETFR